MKRPYKAMLIQDDGMAKVYHTEDATMYRALAVIENIHALQYPKDKFRITYIEEIIK